MNAGLGGGTSKKSRRRGATCRDGTSHKARHEYVAVADVANAWGEVLSAVRARLLSMPTTLATIVANENEVARCHAIIETHVHEALAESG